MLKSQEIRDYFLEKQRPVARSKSSGLSLADQAPSMSSGLVIAVTPRGTLWEPENEEDARLDDPEVRSALKPPKGFVDALTPPAQHLSRKEKRERRRQIAIMSQKMAQIRHKRKIVERRKKRIERQEKGYVLTGKHWGSKPLHKQLARVA